MGSFMRQFRNWEDREMKSVRWISPAINIGKKEDMEID